MDSSSLRNRGYEIQEEIGAGGFGVVYRAFQPTVERDVAIKVILPEISQDPEFAKRFAKEARLVARLEHPNIVPLYDYWQDEERAYLVMRWLKGGSLKKLLKPGPLDPETAVRVVSQITSALETAHEQGVVHRDLKPANVLLDEKGNAYLSDFGIATYLSGGADGGTGGAVIGSPAYMAPEQIMGGQLTTQSDIYSLGLTLFEIVTGETPFGDLDTAAMLYSQVNEPLPFASERNPNLSPTVDQVIQRATVKEPDGRYPDLASLSKAFAKAIMPSGPILGISMDDAPLHNLPAQSSPFIGRDDEVDTLVRHLTDSETRLVTIIGPGGMGKTRLAIAAAETQVDQFEHGVFFVPLAPVEDPEEVPLAIGRAIGFSFPGHIEPEKELVNYLRRRSMLLVLDNFEHLVSAALVVNEIIRSAPDVQIIVTTRQRLQLHDEQLYHLQGLSIPSGETDENASDYAAVQLFMQSASRVKEDFVLAESDLGAISQICRLIQGMPLGILLSAGWIEMLTPSEIREELTQGVDILETTLLDIPERQRSMRAVFDYTWDYLNTQERELLVRLSVFRGGCTISAARVVTGASLSALRSLVDKSLIQTSGTGRYEIHEMLRLYAAERLAANSNDQTKIFNAHGTYYLEAVAQREQALFSDQFVTTMDELSSDLANVRAAWRWAVERGHADLLEQAMKCLFHYHYWQNHVQSLFKDAQIVVEHFSDSSIPSERFVLASALLYQGWFKPNLEDKDLVERSLAILREPDLDHLDTRKAQAFGLSRLGHIESLSDSEKSREMLAKSLALSQMVNDRHGQAGTYLRLSNIANNDADFEEGERFARLSQAIRADIGNPLERAESLRFIANALLMQGRIDEGLEIGNELESIAAALGVQFGANVVGMLPVIFRLAGFYEEAYRRYGEVAAANENIGDPTMVKSLRLWQAWVGIHLGDYAHFLSIAEAQKGVYSSRFYLGHLALGRTSSLLALGQVEESLGAARRAVENFQLGGLLPKLSKSLAALAIAQRALGQIEPAQDSMSESLQLAIEMKSPPVLCYSLSAAALILADLGHEERAVSTYSVVHQNPIVANSRWFFDVAGREIEDIIKSLPLASAEAAKIKGEETDWWKTATDLLDDFAQKSRKH